MRTVIIGGGRGAHAIIDLAAGDHLKEISLDICLVVDPDPNAPGLVFAREHGIKTSAKMEDALTLPDLEMVIELTGQDEVLDTIHKVLPRGAHLMDHATARLFWDVANAREETDRQLQEITALEERIETERLFLQNLVDNIPDLLVVLDKDQKAIKVNASFCKFAGLTALEAEGKTCEELLVNTGLAERCRETEHLLDDIFISGNPHSMIWQTKKPEEAYWEVTRLPILDRQGNIEAVLGIWHRITEKVNLKREINTAEQRFRSFIDSAHDWISIKDLNGLYVIVNPVCAEAFKLKPEDFTGRTPLEILDREVAKSIIAHDKNVLKQNKHITFDEIFNINGKDHHFQTVRFPLHDYKGSTIGVCTISRDVSKRRNLQEQLAQSAKLAAVGKLAAGVAHEINNPLTGILAFAEDLAEELENESPYKDDIKVIIRETLRCRDIVRNLLDFSRQDTPQLENIDPNKIVKHSLSLVERLPQFQNIAIEKILNENMPLINCDQHQMQQVILNFMLNSCDAMKGKGAIKVSTDYDRRQDKCIINVQDNGPGIPENLIDKLFEPFFSTKGTSGLGLAVSWRIVERHHGVIEVDIPDNGGAIFRIVMPSSNEDEWVN